MISYHAVKLSKIGSKIVTFVSEMSSDRFIVIKVKGYCYLLELKRLSA